MSEYNTYHNKSQSFIHKKLLYKHHLTLAPNPPTLPTKPQTRDHTNDSMGILTRPPQTLLLPIKREAGRCSYKLRA